MSLFPKRAEGVVVRKANSAVLFYTHGGQAAISFTPEVKEKRGERWELPHNSVQTCVEKGVKDREQKWEEVGGYNANIRRKTCIIVFTLTCTVHVQYTVVVIRL